MEAVRLERAKRCFLMELLKFDRIAGMKTGIHVQKKKRANTITGGGEGQKRGKRKKRKYRNENKRKEKKERKIE